MDFLLAALIFLAGAAFGITVASVGDCIKVIGDLRIDRSDPDGPFLFLELNANQSVERLTHKTFVMLKVNARDYISQE